jgi:hypothetical protein
MRGQYNGPSVDTVSEKKGHSRCEVSVTRSKIVSD